MFIIVKYSVVPFLGIDLAQEEQGAVDLILCFKQVAPEELASNLASFY